eukprot:6952986-Pyramimonas_sp.AAC.1
MWCPPSAPMHDGQLEPGQVGGGGGPRGCVQQHPTRPGEGGCAHQGACAGPAGGSLALRSNAP